MGSIAGRINAAVLRIPGMTERILAEKTGISQPTINRIKQGHREPKMNELIAISLALGCTIGELTGSSPVAQRLTCSARATQSGATAEMQAELTHYFELDAYLAEQGILA